MSGKGENATPIGNERMYEHVADMYREAARTISEREGPEIAPHQLQAITWLQQQRMNTLDDQTRPGGTAKGIITGMRNAWDNWADYAREHGLRTELGTTSLPPTPITEAEVAASGGLGPTAGPAAPCPRPSSTTSPPWAGTSWTSPGPTARRRRAWWPTGSR